MEVKQITRNIRVNQDRRDINLRRVERSIVVNSVGRRGVPGPNGIVSHGTVADTDRPDISTPVIWIGSVEPLNVQEFDIWIDTA